MKKRILSMLLAVLMVVGMLSAMRLTASAAEKEYEFDSTTGTIEAYLGDGGDVEIPASIDGVEVQIIGADAFSGNSFVTSVTIPSTVTSINGRAFQNCSEIKSVTIKGSGVTIGESAFCNCDSLTTVTMEGNINLIGNKAFAECGSRLRKVNYYGLEEPSFPKNATVFSGSNSVKIYVTSGYEGTTFCEKTVESKFIEIPRYTISVDGGLSNGTISFVVNGSESSTAKENDTITVIPSAAEGYEVETVNYHDGSSAYSVVKTEHGYSFIMPAKDVTLTATWKAKQYTITFDTCGGSVIDEMILEYGSTIVPPKDPTKTGYVFAGWSQELPAKMPAENINLTAKWGPAEDTKYSVVHKFEKLDGTYEVLTEEMTGTTNAATAAEAKTEVGFTAQNFQQGTIAADGTTRVEIVYKRSQHTLTFILNNGEKDITSVIKYGENIVLPSDPVKIGHSFAGWGDVASTMPDVDVSYTAQWTVNQYTITFDSDGGSAIAPITQDYASTVTPPDAPTRSGYTFTGWTSELPITMPAENLILKALWAVNQYTITFDTCGGSNVYPITQDYGSAVIQPDDPERVGYTFSGWVPEIPVNMPAENIMVQAQWTANQYKITFDTNGGSEVAVIIQDYDTIVKEPDEPTRIGYTFAGWLDETGQDFVFTETTVMGAEDILLTAKWNPAKGTGYTVMHRFENLDGTFDEQLEEKTGTTGEETKAAAKTVEGFTAQSFQQGTIAADGSAVVEIVYTRNEYTLTFRPDNGEEDIVATVKYGAAITAPADPTKTGYSFAGWGTVPATMPADDVTLTAQWTVNRYTITFDTDGGSAVDAITQDYGTAVTAPANPTKTGYTFAGWDKAIPATMPADDVTLTAQWTVNRYTITFDTDGGSAIDAITQDYGTAVTAPANPTKGGYTFAGWDQEIPDTVPAEDMTVTAKWMANSYVICFDANGGSGTAPDQEFVYDTPQNLTKNAFTRRGFQFVGWSTEKNMTGEMYADEASVRNMTAGKDAVVKLYAMWEKAECAEDAFCPTSNYFDVESTAWYHEGVCHCLHYGIMIGYQDNEFRPETTATRAMLVTMLWRMEGEPASIQEHGFTDIDEREWYSDAFRWAKEKGIVQGYGDGTARPDDEMLREEMVALLFRFAKACSYDINPQNDLSRFSDKDQVSAYALDSMEWAVGANLILGIEENELEPLGTSTRAQLATVIYRFDTTIQKQSES